METIIKRIREYLESSNISIRQFEITIGASNGAISRAIKNETDIQSKWLSKIIDNYTDINAEWLISGKGSMKKQNLRKYSYPKNNPTQANEELEEYIYASKGLFNKLKNTGLTSEQIKLLESIEDNYDQLLNQNIIVQKKIIKFYENKSDKDKSS